MSTFPIPHKILNHHAVALGKTRSGKSSTMRVAVEFLLDEAKRVCIIDPKGDWWGLGADGTGNGFSVVLLGDFKKADVDRIPITKNHGKECAKLVLSDKRTFVIGMRGWSQGAMTRFWIDFAETLFNEANDDLHVVVDEIHNFAPKGRVMSVESGECVHWTNRLMSEGGGLGLKFLIASQRPQKVHNDTLTCCETLIALKVIHAADREAVKDWIDGCGDNAIARPMIDTLASLNRGESWVWCPEEKFGPQKVQFPLFRSYDSFAPPAKQERKIRRREMPLDELRKKMATVVQEAEANDPAKLRAEIERMAGELKRQAMQMEDQSKLAFSGAEPHEVKAVADAAYQEGARVATNDAYDAGEIAGYKKRDEEVRGVMEQASYVLDVINRQPIGELLPQFARQLAGNSLYLNASTPPAKTGRIEVIDARPPKTPAPARPALAGGGSTAGLTQPQQRILDTCAMLWKRGYQVIDRDMLARWIGLHPNGGTFKENLAKLRTEGYLDGFTPTAKAKVKIETTGYHAMLGRLHNGGQANIVDTLMRNPKQSFDRESLAAALQLHPNGGTYKENLALLRTMNIITPRAPIALTPQVFA